jgi:hypothetical protein
MNTGPHKLTDADRAELCRRVDLAALLAGDGVEVRRNGAAYVCKMRPDERTASCHVWPPGAGKRGADGWTWHDYGASRGGDTLGYLVDIKGLPFVEAVGELCRLAGWTPESLQGNRPACPSRPTAAAPATLPPPSASVPPVLPLEAQARAVGLFLDALLQADEETERDGALYLASRGCLPEAWPGGAWHLRADVCRILARTLSQGPDADLLTRAGLLKPAADGKPPRLPWWDAVCLLACRAPDLRPAYLVGRRLSWAAGDSQGKFINQPAAAGAVRLPYNLPALYRAAGRLAGWPVPPAPAKAGDVLLVEGPLDALGAAVLGWPAVALLTRLQAHAYNARHGAAAQMLDAHLPALRDVRRVRVVPDADPGAKGAEGEAHAARLVAWLRCAGVRADLATLADLCPDAPPACKDLADIAKLKGCLAP